MAAPTGTAAHLSAQVERQRHKQTASSALLSFVSFVSFVVN
jgi:hypothetical protein